MQITLCNGRAHKYRRGNQEGSFELGKMKREKGQSKQKTRGQTESEALCFHCGCVGNININKNQRTTSQANNVAVFGLCF